MKNFSRFVFTVLCIFTLSACAKDDKNNSCDTYDIKRIYNSNQELVDIEIDAKSRENLLCSANAGADADQYNLALMFEYGYGGFQKNIELAAKLYEKLAYSGDHNAQHKYGKMLLEGNGVPQNIEEGLKWINKAADANESFAISALADYYETGKYLKKDPKKAVELYEKAAYLGNARSQNDLGNIYGLGKIVKQDKVKAYAWIKLARHNPMLKKLSEQEMLNGNIEYLSSIMSTQEKQQAEQLYNELHTKISPLYGSDKQDVFAK